jgi:hypothetical protein
MRVACEGLMHWLSPLLGLLAPRLANHTLEYVCLHEFCTSQTTVCMNFELNYTPNRHPTKNPYNQHTQKKPCHNHSPWAAWAAGPSFCRLWDESVDHEGQVQALPYTLLHWPTTCVHAGEGGLCETRSSGGDKSGYSRVATAEW